MYGQFAALPAPADALATAEDASTPSLKRTPARDIPVEVETDANASLARLASTFIVIEACSGATSTSVAPVEGGSFLSWYIARSCSTGIPTLPLASLVPKIASSAENSTSDAFF